ncbi:MAG TPA: hypothetical protein PLD95_03435 [bacterium]|jgi:hypothetical protein|nr:hypothetical protein [bacterium]HOG38499.1 hypothetical protein [bacterium]
MTSFKTGDKVRKNYKVVIIISFFILIIGIFIFFCLPVVFQEGNPGPQIKGIVELSFTNKNIVKLSSSENKYMTKSKNGAEVIKFYMKDRGYNFTEQMGSAYFFKSMSGESVIVTHKYYS